MIGGVLLFLLGAVVGGFVQLALTVVFDDPFRKFYVRIRSRARQIRSLMRGETFGGQDHYRLGSWETPCVILEGTATEPFRPENLLGRLDETPLELPDDLAARVSATTSAQHDIAERRGHPTFFNGPMVALEEWTRSRTPGDEHAQVELSFKLTDYYTFLSTAMSLNERLTSDEGDVTVRDVHLGGSDYRRPNPVMATSFGVNLAFITKDRFTICARRGTAGISNYGGKIVVPIVESVHPVHDLSPRKHIDFYRTAARGASEELNVEITDAETQMYSLLVDSVWYLYGLSGAVFSKTYTKEDVLARRSVGVKDKWENAALDFVPFAPAAVAEYIRMRGGPSQFHPASLVSLTQSLLHYYRAKDVAEAFRKASAQN